MPQGQSLSLSLSSLFLYFKVYISENQDRGGSCSEVNLRTSSLLQSVNIWKPRQRWFLFRGHSQDQLFTTKCGFLGTDRGCPFPEVNLRTSSWLQSVNLRTSSLLQSENPWNQDGGGSCSEVNLRTSSLLQSVDFWQPTQGLSFSWGQSLDQLCANLSSLLQSVDFWKTDNAWLRIQVSLQGCESRTTWCRVLMGRIFEPPNWVQIGLPQPNFPWKPNL